MPKRRDQDFVSDIREAIQRIAAYTEGMTYLQFIKDNKTQDAVVRNLEVIGEATKNLSSRLRKMYLQIPWKDLAGVRNKVNYPIAEARGLFLKAPVDQPQPASASADIVKGYVTG